MNRAYFFTKALSCWTLLTSAWTSTIKGISDFYHHMHQYLSGTTQYWMFLEGHTLPLPLSCIQNKIHPTWGFSNHHLVLFGTGELSEYRLSWLSAKIMVVEKQEEHTFDIDTFLETFRLITYDNQCPTLTTLFMCWCAETQQWFRNDCVVHFYLIDDEGQEQTLSLRADNKCLEIREDKLHHRVPCTQESTNAYTYYHG